VEEYKERFLLYCAAEGPTKGEHPDKWESDLLDVQPTEKSRATKQLDHKIARLRIYCGCCRNITSPGSSLLRSASASISDSNGREGPSNSTTQSCVVSQKLSVWRSETR
jgi:hypothetical protein